MRRHSNTLRYALAATALLLSLTLSACGPTSAPSPTPDVNAIYTAAFNTFTAQQATEKALTPPTATSTVTPAPTSLLTGTPGASLPVTGSTPGLAGTPGATGGTAAASACDNAVYVSDATIPDGTVVNAGQTFVKTWTILNKGTCPWSAQYHMVFVGGDAMGGQASVPLSAPVPAGSTSQISVTLTAPAAAGNYTGTWQLQNAAGVRFGDTFTVVIKVGGGGGNNQTPQATSTP